MKRMNFGKKYLIEVLELLTSGDSSPCVNDLSK